MNIYKFIHRKRYKKGKSSRGRYTFYRKISCEGEGEGEGEWHTALESRHMQIALGIYRYTQDDE